MTNDNTLQTVITSKDIKGSIVLMEGEIESHIILGSRHLAQAWRLLAVIQKEGLWASAVTAEGEAPSTFMAYVKDFIGRTKDRNPAMQISASMVYDHVMWVRRALASGIDEEQVLTIPQRARNELSRSIEFDRATGEIVSVDEKRVDIDKLPGEGTPRERMVEFMGDVAHSSPHDAVELVKGVMRGHEELFSFKVVVYEGHITRLLCQEIILVDEQENSVRWHDLFADKLPDSILKELSRRLDTYPSADDDMERKAKEIEE